MLQVPFNMIRNADVKSINFENESSLTAYPRKVNSVLYKSHIEK